MKRFILSAALCLMFITPANAIGPNDVLLTCWTDDDFELISEATTVVLNIDDETAELIDPHNRLRKGSLTVTEYFYIIKIPESTQYSKFGEIKINRFTGRLSSHWQYPTSNEGEFSKGEDIYGICTKLPNSTDRAM